MNTQTFKTKNGLELVIKSRKSAVIFEIDKNKSEKEYNFLLKFSTEGFNDLLKYIEDVSNKSWGNLSPKEVDNMGADYFEYYDRELDNNGYLTIRQNELIIERPSLESNRLYQFNKKKMESFIYDFRKAIQ